MVNEIPVVFHNVSNYDYYFIIQKCANEFQGKFNCFGENTEKYKLFSAVTISYKIKIIYRSRSMATSLSNLVGNLTEAIHKIKCKDYDRLLEYESVKDNLMKHNCLSCNKDYSNKTDKEIKKGI